MCFLGDAHAGVSCRVQLGDPPRPGSTAEVGLIARRSSAEALTFLAPMVPVVPEAFWEASKLTFC